MTIFIVTVVGVPYQAYEDEQEALSSRDLYKRLYNRNEEVIVTEVNYYARHKSSK